MPTITRLPDEEAAFMDRLRRKHADRPPGLHVTDAIWCNIRAIVKPALLAAGIEVPFSDAKILQFETGKLWEKVMVKYDWMQQRQLASGYDRSVGTIDAVLPRTWFPIEAKTTKGSSLAELPDATQMQIGEYAARLMLKLEGHNVDPNQSTTWEGRVRIIHINGDCGKNKCPEHGYPESEVRRLNPDSKRQRLCCPECQGWLSGDQSFELRHYKMEWTREELIGLHKIITWRLARVKAGREAFTVGDPLPEWQWGYPKTECPSCEAKDLIGCPGQEDTDQMEAEMKGSIFEPERETATA